MTKAERNLLLEIADQLVALQLGDGLDIDHVVRYEQTVYDESKSNTGWGKPPLTEEYIEGLYSAGHIDRYAADSLNARL